MRKVEEVRLALNVHGVKYVYTGIQPSPINTKEGLHNAREWKLSKENYIVLFGDLQSKGFIAELKTIEVGSLSHFSSASIHSIHAILSHLKHRSVCNMLLSLTKRLSPAPKLFSTASAQPVWIYFLLYFFSVLVILHACQIITLLYWVTIYICFRAPSSPPLSLISSCS